MTGSFENPVKITKQWCGQEHKGIIITACGITILIVILVTQYVSIGSMPVDHVGYSIYGISINEKQIKSFKTLLYPP